MALANDQRSQLEALYAEMAPANLTPCGNCWPGW
jgi:hypothetical protein